MNAHTRHLTLIVILGFALLLIATVVAHVLS